MANPSRESGQIIVLVALLLVGLVAMLGLVLDGGGMYMQRRRMQNAADAGAIAGAVVMAEGADNAQAEAKATEYTMAHNQAEACEVTIDGARIAVVAKVGYPTTFARIVGLDHVTVTARAVAGYAPVGSLYGVAPIAVRDFDYQFSVPYTIWDDTKDADPTSGQIQGGYRGWLNLECVYPMKCGDGGASDLKEWMTGGYPGHTNVDTWIRGSSGVKTSVIEQAQVGQILKVVIFDAIETKFPGKEYYHALKFAAFKVSKVYASGTPKGIQGTFECYFFAGPPGNGEDGGVRTVTLMQ